MGLFEFIKRTLGITEKINDSINKLVTNDNVSSVTIDDFKTSSVDENYLTGEYFEFLIIGDFDVFSDFDNIMTPNSFEWKKETRNDWHYYQIGQDEFCYSIEEPGIQMTFNKEIPFDKAKKIGDEIIANIKATGQKAELKILDNKKAFHID